MPPKQGENRTTVEQGRARANRKSEAIRRALLLSATATIVASTLVAGLTIRGIAATRRDMDKLEATLNAPTPTWVTSTPLPTNTPTEIPSPTPTSTATHTPSPTPTETLLPTWTATPTQEATSTATATSTVEVPEIPKPISLESGTLIVVPQPHGEHTSAYFDHVPSKYPWISEDLDSTAKGDTLWLPGYTRWEVRDYDSDDNKVSHVFSTNPEGYTIMISHTSKVVQREDGTYGVVMGHDNTDIPHWHMETNDKAIIDFLQQTAQAYGYEIPICTGTNCPARPSFKSSN